MPEYGLHDSGARSQFETGAVRDAGDWKGFFHCIPYLPLERLAQHYERGAKKYAKNNWMKGIPLSRYLDSLMRHAFKLAECRQDEDHAAAVAWNAFGFMWTAAEIEAGRLPSSLDDIGWMVERALLRAQAGQETGGDGQVTVGGVPFRGSIGPTDDSNDPPEFGGVPFKRG